MWRGDGCGRSGVDGGCRPFWWFGRRSGVLLFWLAPASAGGFGGYRKKEEDGGSGGSACCGLELALVALGLLGEGCVDFSDAGGVAGLDGVGESGVVDGRRVDAGAGVLELIEG